MLGKTAEFTPFCLDPRQYQQYTMPQYDQYMTDEEFPEFSDTLFTSLNNNMPFAFPNPKELCKSPSSHSPYSGLFQEISWTVWSFLGEVVNL